MTDEIEPHVRVGTTDDLDGMMQIAMMATDENGLTQKNPTKLLHDIWPALNQDRGIVGIIGDPGEQIEAAILLRIGTMWYSDDLVIEEKAIFVHPDFRSAKGGRARRLSRFAKSVSDKLELPLVIGVLSSERTAGKIRMYEREFGAPSGVFFIYGAQTGAAGKPE